MHLMNEEMLFHAFVTQLPLLFVGGLFHFFYFFFNDLLYFVIDPCKTETWVVCNMEKLATIFNYHLEALAIFQMLVLYLVLVVKIEVPSDWGICCGKQTS